MQCFVLPQTELLHNTKGQYEYGKLNKNKPNAGNF